MEDGRVCAIDPADRRAVDSLGGPEMATLPWRIDVQINGAVGLDFSGLTADMDLVGGGLSQFGVTPSCPRP